MKKKALIVLLAAALVLCLGATMSQAQAKPRIGYITRLSVPWWIVCEKGFRDAAAKFGFTPVIYHPPQLTVEDQVRVLESWTAAGLDGVFIGPNDPGAPINAINSAIDEGIPVLTGYGVDSPGSKRLLFIGYDAYQSIQGTASMDIAEVKARYGDRITLWGGVALERLQSGTPEEVRADVRRAMECAKPGGRFILGSSHSIAVGTKYDNFMAMLDEYHKLADY